MIRKSSREYTDRTPRQRWKGTARFITRPELLAYLPTGVDLPEGAEEGPESVEAALVEAGVDDITISDILEAHDRWQEEAPDDPDAIHRFVDESWAAKRAKKVDVG